MQNVSAELTGPSQTVTAGPDDNLTQNDDNNPELPVQTFTPASGNDDSCQAKYEADDEDLDMDPTSPPADNAEDLQQADTSGTSDLSQSPTHFVLESSIGDSGQSAAEDGEDTSSDELNSHSSDEFEGIALVGDDQWINPHSPEFWVIDQELDAVINQGLFESDEEERE